MMQKNIEKYYQTYAKLSDVGSHLGSIGLVLFPLWRVFFATRLSEPLGATPLDRFWPPLGHPWSDCVTFLKDFGSKFTPNFKDSKATNVTNHTFKKTSKD